MQPLIINQTDITPFQFELTQPFVFASNTLTVRKGFYLSIETLAGISVKGEASPLPGVSEETDRRARHDLEDVCILLKEVEVPADKDELFIFMKEKLLLHNYCSSVRFAVESALISLAAKASGLALVEFLGGQVADVSTAALLQGMHVQVLADAKRMMAQGYKVFKLKIGNRNIALDIKKVQDLRMILDKDCLLRLDANRVWSLKEANIFAELSGHERIEFIEEPLSEVARLNEFYQANHMPIALDETLAVIPCGLTAPGRCMPTLANNEGVKAYVLKPTILGLVKSLEWIREARAQGKKAIISSAFESPVGLKVLANLACLTGQTAGLGTERWFKNVKPLVNESGIIPSVLLK